MASNHDPVCADFVDRTVPRGGEGPENTSSVGYWKHLLLVQEENISFRELDEFQVAVLESHLQFGWLDPEGKQQW